MHTSADKRKEGMTMRWTAQRDFVLALRMVSEPAPVIVDTRSAVRLRVREPLALWQCVVP